MEKSYAVLFGKSAKPYHHTIGDEGLSFTLEYDPDNSCYHVPFDPAVTNYTAVLDTLKRKGDTIDVRVCYVSNTDLTVDLKGNTIPPTPDQAAFVQIYTVKKNGDDGWMLTAIRDEGK